MTQTVADLFKQFWKERHEEDKILNKNKNFNYLQETYANTELFDISLYEKNISSLKMDTTIGSNVLTVEINELKNFSLPFESNFVKFNDNFYVFIKEFAPNILTGTLFIIDIFDTYKINKISFNTNLTFSICLDYNTFQLAFDSKSLSVVLNKLEFDTSQKWYSYLKKNNIQDINQLQYAKEKFISEWKQKEKNFMNQILSIVIITCYALDNLSKKSVVVDTSSAPQTEYYNRKHADTIKRYNRPIYYVLDKKEETKKVNYYKIQSRGHLEFTHAFKVRGHWRKISDKSLGKDRNGNYSIYGHTWVTEYIKGEGELTKRLRVIKN